MKRLRRGLSSGLVVSLTNWQVRMGVGRLGTEGWECDLVSLGYKYCE